jgi:hypothetical protein
MTGNRAWTARGLSRRDLLAGLIGFGIIEPGPSGIARAAEHVLVAHKSAGIIEATLDRVRKILSLRQAQWDNGAPVILVLPPRNSAPMRWITEDLLGLPETTYRRLLLAEVFRGAARAPIEAESVGAAAAAVATKAYTITALPRESVPSSVVVIAIRSLLALVALSQLIALHA